jgi:hypothetical protein
MNIYSKLTSNGLCGFREGDKNVKVYGQGWMPSNDNLYTSHNLLGQPGELKRQKLLNYCVTSIV